MYSSARLAVNVGTPLAALSMGLILSLGAVSAQKISSLSCEPALTALFTPPRPQLGTYEVCVTADPLREVAEPGWTIEPTAPLDAFSDAGPYDRTAITHLYVGRRPLVAHGWKDDGHRLESITLISPYPDPTFSRLVSGTLVIR